VPGRTSSVKMVGIADMGALFSLDGVTVHPDCWCICLCYLHFPPENPEDGEIYLLVPSHPGCPGQSPESVVCVFGKYTVSQKTTLTLHSITSTYIN